MTEPLGKLGKYQILGIIGRGGMGTVYRAFDPVLSRPVALKVVSSEGDLSAEQKARLLREGKACAQLTHPNIISIHDLGEDGDRIFIVMELLQGKDLKQVIAAHAALSLAEKLSLMVQVCDGLHYAHQNGIVHRDIKPANIFVLPNQLIKILDFGLAHLTTAESSLTQTGQIVGTLAYMAPERFRGPGDHRGDIFAVGAVGYELLSGRRAFVGESAVQLIEAIRTIQPPPLMSIDPSLPPELAAAIESALRKDPSARVADLALLRAALDTVRQRLVASVEASTRLVPVTSSADGESAPPDLADARSPSLSAASNARPRTATLVGRFGAHFRRFRLAISISFTVTVAVLLYLVNSADYARLDPTRQQTTSAPQSAPGVTQPRNAPDGHVVSSPRQEPTQPPPVAQQPPAAPPALAAKPSVPATAPVPPSLPPAPTRRDGTNRAGEKPAPEPPPKQKPAPEPPPKPPQIAAVKGGPDAAQAQRAAVDARQDAEKAQAPRYAATTFAAALQKKTDGDALIGREDFPAARKHFEEAQAMYRQAAQEAVAMTQRRQSETEQARGAMQTARRAADQATADKYAPTLLAAGHAKERDGQTAFGRSDYDLAIRHFRDAQAEYQAAAQAAAQEAKKEETRLQQVAALQTSTDQSRKEMEARRDQAVKAEADRLAKNLFDAGQTKQAEATTLASRQSFAAATKAYQDATERYREAADRARIMSEARAQADSAKVRMLVEKQRADQTGPEFSAAEAEERQANASYENFAYKEAADRFAIAETLYAKKTPQLAPR
jgi:serine/threonine protein kinase